MTKENEENDNNNKIPKLNIYMYKPHETRNKNKNFLKYIMYQVPGTLVAGTTKFQKNKHLPPIIRT